MWVKLSTYRHLNCTRETKYRTEYICTLSDKRACSTVRQNGKPFWPLCVTIKERFPTCLDLSAPGNNGAAEPVKSLCDVRSWTSNQLFLQFAVDALKIAQFNLLSDDCLRLLDEASLNRLHLEHHLIHTRISALQITSSFLVLIPAFTLIRKLLFIARP